MWEADVRRLNTLRTPLSRLREPKEYPERLKVARIALISPTPREMRSWKAPAMSQAPCQTWWGPIKEYVSALKEVLDKAYANLITIWTGKCQVPLIEGLNKSREQPFLYLVQKWYYRDYYVTHDHGVQFIWYPTSHKWPLSQDGFLIVTTECNLSLLWSSKYYISIKVCIAFFLLLDLYFLGIFF